MFTEISAITIDNGLPNPGDNNNILIFPSLEKYQEIIDALNVMVDEHNDTFEANADPELTGEEYEDLALANGFDEDQPLIDFEGSLSFSSLRKKLFDDELDWLSIQTDGEWNADEDPDNHHIFDDTERALLNIGSEFIVGTSEENYVIYKLINDCFAIKIHDFDLELLRLINIDPVDYIDNTTNYPENLTVIIAEPCSASGGSTGGGSGCKGTQDIRKFFSTGSETKIQAIIKIKQPFYTGSSYIGSSKIKAKTKYYRKNTRIFGGWRKGITTITAGITGEFQWGSTWGLCDIDKPIDEWQTKKRHKVKVSRDYNLNTLSNAAIKVKGSGNVFGVHKRRTDVTKTIDFYNGQVF